MNWTEALEAMKQGHKVVNSYFCTGEYFHMIGGDVYGEDGVPMDGWYQDQDWQKSGWTVVS